MEPLSSIFQAFDTATEKARKEGTQKQLARLYRDHQISGSAVIPNLADPDLTDTLNRLHETYEERFEREKARRIAAHDRSD